MNRLWVRLALAIAACTLVSVGTVAVFADWLAANEFQQYVGQQQLLAQSGLLDELAAYYQRQGNWDGVQVILAGYAGPGMGGGPGAGRGRPSPLLADATGLIVYDARTGRTGGTLTAADQAQAQAVSAGGQTVAYLLVAGAGRGGQGLAAAEQAFLAQLRNTVVFAALLALGLGLILSVWISWTLSAPLARVRLAARALANQQWDQRVPVRGADEVADVARSINSMADELQSAEVRRRNLFADIAHELRTPLTVLQGNLRALLDGVYPLEPGEIATVYDQSRLLGRLVDDLGQLALAEAGHLHIDLAELEVGPIIRATVDALSGAAQAQSVSLDVVTGSPLPPVQADASRLAQVLHNLLANALRHTPQGGRISITAEAEGQGVRLVVSDTGEGIAPADLPHIFERFYRADKTRARATGGSGLGLAIAKALVEAMGGAITAESQLGAGSTFSVVLPASARR